MRGDGLRLVIILGPPARIPPPSNSAPDVAIVGELRDREGLQSILCWRSKTGCGFDSPHFFRVLEPFPQVSEGAANGDGARRAQKGRALADRRLVAESDRSDDHVERPNVTRTPSSAFSASGGLDSASTTFVAQHWATKRAREGPWRSGGSAQQTALRPLEARPRSGRLPIRSCR